MNPGPHPEHTSTWRQQMALETWLDRAPGDTIGDLHRKFCQRLRCIRCGKYEVCDHRNRAEDIRLITRDAK